MMESKYFKQKVMISQIYSLALSSLRHPELFTELWNHIPRKHAEQKGTKTDAGHSHRTPDSCSDYISHPKVNIFF